MPSRSKIAQLPPEIQEELNKRLVENAFSGYEGLEAWLYENGFFISKSSLHRHGQEFERNLAAMKLATEQAKAVVDSSPDEEGAMSEALIRLIQQKAFDQLINLSGDQDVSLTSLGRMVADLSRASISQKKFADDVREKIATRFKKLEKEAGGKKSELDRATLARAMKEIYGVF